MGALFDELEKKIASVIAEAIPDGVVEINDTPVGNVHVFVQSQVFAGLSESARDRKLWPVFEHRLTADELLRISVCVLLAPGESDYLQVGTGAAASA